MADNNIPAYPYMFDPSQFTNKFSNYAGKALPWPSQYAGVPTDALGNPIQSYLDTQAKHDAWAATNPAMPPSTTLNSSPTYGLQPSDLAKPSTLNPTGNVAFGMANWGGMMSPQARDLYANAQFDQPGEQPGSGRLRAAQGNFSGQAQPAAGAQPAAQQNPYDMNAAYLNALANPGKVQTGGATVPQAPTPTGQSGVLQQFLANWQNKGSPTQGAGNYNNSGFFNALKGQV